MADPTRVATCRVVQIRSDMIILQRLGGQAGMIYASLDKGIPNTVPLGECFDQMSDGTWRLSDTQAGPRLLPTETVPSAAEDEPKKSVEPEK